MLLWNCFHIETFLDVSINKLAAKHPNLSWLLVWVSAGHCLSENMARGARSKKAQDSIKSYSEQLFEEKTYWLFSSDALGCRDENLLEGLLLRNSNRTLTCASWHPYPSKLGYSMHQSTICYYFNPAQPSSRLDLQCVGKAAVSSWVISSRAHLAAKLQSRSQSAWKWAAERPAEGKRVERRDAKKHTLLDCCL